MTSEKTRRAVAAIGFLSGVLTSLSALRNASIFWPPDVVWAVLRGPQRLELAGGLALILITLLSSALLQRDQ